MNSHCYYQRWRRWRCASAERLHLMTLSPTQPQRRPPSVHHPSTIRLSPVHRPSIVRSSPVYCPFIVRLSSVYCPSAALTQCGHCTSARLPSARPPPVHRLSVHPDTSRPLNTFITSSVLRLTTCFSPQVSTVPYNCSTMASKVPRYFPLSTSSLVPTCTTHGFHTSNSSVHTVVHIFHPASTGRPASTRRPGLSPRPAACFIH